jgi:hypothetical protein
MQLIIRAFPTSVWCAFDVVHRLYGSMPGTRVKYAAFRCWPVLPVCITTPPISLHFLHHRKIVLRIINFIETIDITAQLALISNMRSLLCCFRGGRESSPSQETSPAATEHVGLPPPSPTHSTPTLIQQAASNMTPHPQVGRIAPWTVDQSPAMREPSLVAQGQTIFLLPPVDESPLFDEHSRPDLVVASEVLDPYASPVSGNTLAPAQSSAMVLDKSTGPHHFREASEPASSVEPRNSITSPTMFVADPASGGISAINDRPSFSSLSTGPSHDGLNLRPVNTFAPLHAPTVQQTSSLLPLSTHAPSTADDAALDALLQSLSFFTTWAELVRSAAPVNPTLVARFQALPKELQDGILDIILASTMPSHGAIVNIDDTRSPDKIPTALHINQKSRSKYAEQYYRHGRFEIAPDANWTPTQFASRILRWVAMVDVKHRGFINAIRVGVPEVKGAPEFRAIYLTCLMLAVRRHPLLKKLDIHEMLCLFDGKAELTAAHMELGGA